MVGFEVLRGDNPLPLILGAADGPARWVVEARILMRTLFADLAK